jgi:hypothetical protein
MLEELDNVLLVQDLSGLRKSFLLQPGLLPAELFLLLLSLFSLMVMELRFRHGGMWGTW